MAVLKAYYRHRSSIGGKTNALSKIAKATKLLPEALAMNLVTATGALKNYRPSGGASVVAPFVDRLAAIAKQNGIVLDES
jgi:hypothetical protein